MKLPEPNQPLTEEHLQLIAIALMRRAPDNEGLAALGLSLVMCAAARSGETLLESSDYFKLVCVKAEKELKHKWDLYRTLVPK